MCAILFAPEIPTIISNQAAFNTRTNAVYIFNQPLQPGQSEPGVLLDQATETVRSFVLMDGSYSGGTLGRWAATRPLRMAGSTRSARCYTRAALSSPRSASAAGEDDTLSPAQIAAQTFGSPALPVSPQRS